MIKKNEYVSCNIIDGLGNQLFQIATILEYSKKYKKIPVFPFPINNNIKTYWDTLFFNNLNLSNIDNYIILNDLQYIYGNIILNVDFNSFVFLSKKTRLLMQNYIYSNEDFMYYTYNIYNNIKNIFNNQDDNDYISLHITDTNSLNIDYYKKAYNIICNNNTDKNIIIIADNNDILKWCKNNITFINNIYFVDIDDIDNCECIKLLLMSFIKHNILSNSPISWWGSYISNYDNKNVIASKLYDNDKKYLSSWIII